MSATGRKAEEGQWERLERDQYETPGWAVRAILPHLFWDCIESALDPCCGRGSILNEVASYRSGVTVAGIEVDEALAGRARHGVQACDALELAKWPAADLIITNPPFSLAMDFVRRALAESASGRDSAVGQVAFLLPITWLAGKCRREFHIHNPSDVHVISKRPGFMEHLRWGVSRCTSMIKPRKPTGTPKRCDRELGHEGNCATIGTDASEYAWYVWGPGRGHRWFVLDSEP